MHDKSSGSHLQSVTREWSIATHQGVIHDKSPGQGEIHIKSPVAYFTEEVNPSLPNWFEWPFIKSQYFDCGKWKYMGIWQR